MDKTKKKNFNNKLLCLLAFIIPVLVIFIVFCIKGVWFDGEKLCFGDMQAQYVDMIIYFRKMLLGQENVFYSVLKGLGGDMYSTFAYYMISPLNIITIFFKEADIMQSIYLIILLKMGLSGFSMYKLLDYKNNNYKFINLGLSLCYALMAYLVNVYFCIMWFDVVYMAPLVIIGLDKLINENKISTYIITLFLALLFNYYLGYMLCIFLVIYFIYTIFNKYKDNFDKEKLKKNISNFVISSLIAGLLTSIIWLPAILDLLKVSRDLAGDTTTIISTIKTFLIGSYDENTMLNYYQPNAYCSILVLVSIIAYFFNNKNSISERISTLIVILIFILSIFIPALSLVWHGFSYPIGYNFRFTYLLCLFLIIIAHKELTTLKKTRKSLIIGLSIFSILVLYFVKTKFSCFGGWLSISLIIIYSLIFISKIPKNIKNIMIILIVIIELCINTYLSIIPAENPTTYKSYLNNICENITTDDSFYRISGYEYYGINATLGCNRSTTSGFYSTLNDNITKFYGKVGFSGGVNVYNDILDNTPIVDSLLGVKYLYSREKLNNYKLLKDITIRKNTKTSDGKNDIQYEEKNFLYENTNALSLGYMIKSTEEFKSSSVYDYQNRLIKNISGISEDVLKPLLSEKNNKNLKNSKYIYIIIYTDNSGFSVNGIEYNPIEPGKILAIENNFNSDNVKIEVPNLNQDAYEIFYLNSEAFEKAINILKEEQVENIKVNKSTITGTIDVKEKGTLMMSIPYEDGWTVYVDDKKVDHKKAYDLFTTVELEKGHHEIKMIYKPKTFKYGFMVSFITLMFTIIYLISNKNEGAKKHEAGKK